MATRANPAREVSASDGTLGTVSEFIVDCEHKTAPIEVDGYPSIRTPNIGRGRLLLEGVNRVSEETYVQWTRRGEPRAGDIILAREAPVGNVAIVPPNMKVCLGQRTVLIRPDAEKVNAQYLTYVLLGDDVQSKIRGMTQGATVGHLNVGDIRALKLPAIPKRGVQDRIADVLSAYDDLIENNTRRVKILEEMARSLYREWFVEFRFPGHKKAKFVETEIGRVPKGWKVVPLSECAELLSGFAFKSAQYTSEGIRLLRGDNLAPGFVRWENAKCWPPDDIDGESRYWLQESDVVLAMDRPWIDAGLKIARVSRFDTPALLVQRVARLRAKADYSQRALYSELIEPRFTGYVRGITTGVNVPHISGPEILQYKVVKPPAPILKDFDSIVDSMHVQVDRLRESTACLAKTRDLLLPRLISGEIELPT